MMIVTDPNVMARNADRRDRRLRARDRVATKKDRHSAAARIANPRDACTMFTTRHALGRVSITERFSPAAKELPGQAAQNAVIALRLRRARRSSGCKRARQSFWSIVFRLAGRDGGPRMSRKNPSPLAAHAAHNPMSRAAVVIRQAADDGHDRGTPGDESGPGPGIMDRPVAFKRGGGVDRIDGMKPKKHRLDRPKRARRERFAEGGTPSSAEMAPYFARQEVRGMTRPEAGGPLADRFGFGVRLPQSPAAGDVGPTVVSGLSGGSGLSGPAVTESEINSRPYGARPAPQRGGHTIPHPPPAFVAPPPEPIDWDRLYYGRRFAGARGGRTKSQQ